MPRTCLITLGATAPFPALLSVSLSPEFLMTLSSQGYTNLTLQCGADLVPAQEWIAKLAPTLENIGLSVRAFGFQGGGLGEEMRECKADASKGRKRGCIVSHAGSLTPSFARYCACSSHG
jgi:beta-1,4-N-acetylglucosaminyltransferase